MFFRESGPRHGESGGAAAFLWRHGPAVALWGVTLVIFWPALRWLMSITLDQQQLLQSFVVFGLASALLGFEERERFKPEWRLGSGALWRLLLAYALVGAAMWLNSPLPMLAALCAALSAAVRFVFGDRARRETRWMVGAFGLFVFFVVAMPFFDWPLRILSGRFGAWLLGALGRQTELSVVLRPEPSLLLVMDGRVFEVAAECNGFGLLTSTCLLALLLAGASRLAWWRRVAKVIACAATGFAGNVLRMVAICLLSGWAGPTHYHIMHETVGATFLFAALATVWRMWR